MPVKQSSSSLKADWVITGGRPGEISYCSRCGEGLDIGKGPHQIDIWIAATKAFIKVHARCKGGYQESVPKTPHDWAHGQDTGVSSATIYAAATGAYSPWGAYDAPYDPSDFGRCYRLLKLFPDMRASLERTVRYSEHWKPFVEHWDELTALYEAEFPTGSAPKLYARIKELRGAS